MDYQSVEHTLARSKKEQTCTKRNCGMHKKAYGSMQTEYTV